MGERPTSDCAADARGGPKADQGRTRDVSPIIGGCVLKMRKKSELPTKICVACGRPFTWRKKWAKVWDEVRYCSERCRRAY